MNAIKRAHALAPKAKRKKAEYQNKHREQFAAYGRAYRKRHPGRATEILRRYRAKNKEKATARNILNAAVRDGKIFSKPCEVCGSKRSEGHHADYAQPLNVRWLCKRHHTDAHMQTA